MQKCNLLFQQLKCTHCSGLILFIVHLLKGSFFKIYIYFILYEF